jgi:hypothetical protein
MTTQQNDEEKQAPNGREEQQNDLNLYLEASWREISYLYIFLALMTHKLWVSPCMSINKYACRFHHKLFSSIFEFFSSATNSLQLPMHAANSANTFLDSFPAVSSFQNSVSSCPRVVLELTMVTIMVDD